MVCVTVMLDAGHMRTRASRHVRAPARKVLVIARFSSLLNVSLDSCGTFYLCGVWRFCPNLSGFSLGTIQSCPH